MGHCARVEHRCERRASPLPFDFTMAFQPIVDLRAGRLIAYEALVRGPGGEAAKAVLSRVTDDLLYRFDQACRVRAIALASELGMQERLSINFLPNAVYDPEASLQATLESAAQAGWPGERIVFEFTASERVTDRGHLRQIIDSYRAMGVTTALDDFGAGYANLDLLTELRPDKLKIDRELVRGCDHDRRRQALLRAVATLAGELEMTTIAEGVETRGEALWLARLGITRQQGFYYARPQVAALSAGLEPRLADLQAAVLKG